VQSGQKAAVVAELASGTGRSLLFTRTKHAARKLARQLSAAGIPAVDLHGNLAQSARDRNLAAFMDGSVRVLVATDIAARGIHVDDISLVVHVDPPAEHKAYLHRSGRTARAGAAGIVVTIVTPDQIQDVRTLVRQAAIRPRAADVAPGDARIAALTGPPAERRFPVAPSVTETDAVRPPKVHRPGRTAVAAGRTRTSYASSGARRRPTGRQR
jgi:superfamily II DNA/RNA helicase